MKTIFASVSLAILSAPLSALACDGSISCAMRNTPRKVLHLLPGFLTTHAGLLIGMILSALVVGILLRREAEIIRKD